jgi:3D (Asp-Asp-Asp) domain-containing protein
MSRTEQHAAQWSPPRTGKYIQFGGVVCLGLLVAASAIVTKEAAARSGLDPLAAVTQMKAAPATDDTPIIFVPRAVQASFVEEFTTVMPDAESKAAEPEVMTVEPKADEAADSDAPVLVDANIRFFNGRPVKPAKTITMTVTAYSPDEASCPGTADGITSSIHNVFTNGMRLVAADSSVLPLGSIISVPGYDAGNIVPVLDRGGAIKGKRLDVLYATHEQARRWGVRKLKVVVYEYADGLPKDDYRAIRDSKN